MPFPPELESKLADRVDGLQSQKLRPSPQLERWEKIERWALLTGSAVAFFVVARFILFDQGHPVVLFLLPLAVWALWQAFFEDKLESGQPPSATERVVATSYLWLRRLILWVIGLPITIYSIIALLETPASSSFGPLGALVLGVAALWVGAFGAGRHKSAVDDLRIHRKRKERYRWWF